MEAFLAADAVPVERMTKKGLRTFDCRERGRGPDGRSNAAGEGASALDLILRHTVPAVRPDDVLTGLAHVAGLRAGEAAAAHPARPGTLDPATGEVGDPLR